MQSEDLEFEEEIFIDENGRKYKILNRVREVPKKIYILGDLNGKYWGEIDTRKENEYLQYKFFDFNIYEVTINNTKVSNSPFMGLIESEFPRERLPKLLPVILSKEGKEYELNLHEPKFILNEKKEGVVFNRKLHQDEGTEVFGTIDAKVTGYVLYFIKEEYSEIIPLNEETLTKNEKNNPEPQKTDIPTRTNYPGRYLPSFLDIMGSVVVVVVFISLLPQLGVLLPLILIPIVLNFIPSTIWNWIIKILAGVLFLSFLASLFYSISNSNSNVIPQKYAVDDIKEQTDTIKRISEEDTIISHFRSWRDYDDNLYEGTYFVKYSAYQKAKSFKNNLQIVGDNQAEYDKILFDLKENDKNNIQGLFQLFDTLKVEKKLDSIAFAKMIVSFVQDIPYVLILPKNCDPSLYADNFIKQYLNSSNAKCDGFEKFGINTPVEFLATLNGDCDTRTLLLYTILAYYNYDLALLSSEVYNHSIIGINLPIEGEYYEYNNQKYILWETTVPGMKPGILPTEISNTNNWRISLKSK